MRILDVPHQQAPSTPTPGILFSTGKNTIQTFGALPCTKFPPDSDHKTYATTQSKQARINQGGSQFAINPSGNIPKQLPNQAVFVSTNQPQYREELSGGYAAPQITTAQMQLFARNAQRQREQAVLVKQKQQEEDRLRLLEKQRMRENKIAEEALREMERAEQERVKKKGVHKPSPISQASPTGNPSVLGKIARQPQDSRVSRIVGGISELIDNAKTSEDIPENECLENIHQDMQYYVNQVRYMTKRPTTAEVDADEYSTLPYDPNLVCYNVINDILERYKNKYHIIDTSDVTVNLYQQSIYIENNYACLQFYSFELVLFCHNV